MKKILILLCTLPLFTHGQYENVWAFGYKAGIDFNYNPPQPFVSGIKSSEASASACNDAGQLLFYTDGYRVWNRNHITMPNGRDLPRTGRDTTYNATGSTTQGAMIIPVPGSTEKYYIFSIGCYECPPFSGNLYYSIVDMALNNGLGDVVPDRKGILLSNRISEKMTAVSGIHCNTWLLVVPKFDDTTFWAYNIGLDGLDSVPIASYKVPSWGDDRCLLGSMDVSPDRTKLAMAEGHLALYDLDRSTGKISNPIVLDRRTSNGYNYYGVSFSPDNSKLYGSIEPTSFLYQFDLSSRDTNAMIASKTLLNRAYEEPSGAIKRGPDGKVYVTGFNNLLHIIQQPNFPGLSCQFTPNSFLLADSTSTSRSLSNFGTIIMHRKRMQAQWDTLYCADSILLRGRPMDGIDYTWEDGSKGRQRYVYESGTYWLRYQWVGDQCEDYVDIDTFHVTLYKINRPYSTTTYTGMCAADTFEMKAAHTHGRDYTWEDGSNGMTRKMNRSGTFRVNYYDDSSCTYYTDIFQLSYPEYKVSFLVDTLICQDLPLTIRNTSDTPYHQFQWFWGDGGTSLLKDPEYVYTQPGTYELLLTGSINTQCRDTVAQVITVDPKIPVRFSLDRNALCMGEYLTVLHLLKGSTISKMLWQWGDDASLYNLTDFTLRHAYDRPGMMDLSLRVDFRGCPADSFSVPVQVYELPDVQLSGDNGLCFQGMPITLKNLSTPSTGRDGSYHWNTGATADSIVVTKPGTYSVTVSTPPLGCSTTETIEISKDCYIDIPNAFTPNGDGVNDYFFPRQLLSEGVSEFKMQIWNRWGQLLFETTTLEGRGWDGQFNGKEQPLGVYAYLLQWINKNRTIENYKGNVTLLR